MSNYKKEELEKLKEQLLELDKIFTENSDKSKEDLIRLIKDKLIKNIKKENKNINDDNIKKEVLNYFKLNLYTINKEIKTLKSQKTPEQKIPQTPQNSQTLQQKIPQKIPQEKTQNQPQQKSLNQQYTEKNERGFFSDFLKDIAPGLVGLIFVIPFMLIFKKNPKTL